MCEIEIGFKPPRQRADRLGLGTLGRVRANLGRCLQESRTVLAHRAIQGLLRRIERKRLLQVEADLVEFPPRATSFIFDRARTSATTDPARTPIPTHRVFAFMSVRYDLGRLG